MQRTVWSLGALLIVTTSAITGCGGDAPNACAGDAATKACMCSDGKSGVQACGVDAGAGGACDCSQGGAVNNGGTSGGTSGNGATAGNGSVVQQDAATSNMTDDDGGASGAADASSDASASNDKDASSSSSPTYSGPCNNDKGCPGDETCVHTGGVSYCARSCMEDKDCPAPDDGKATPSCAGANILLSQPGTCALYCGGLLAGDCPHGMECSALLVLSGECAWKGMI